MFHLMAHTGLLGVGTDLDIAALNDDVVGIVNGHFQLPRPMDLLASMGFSPLLTQYKIVTPLLRQLASPYPRPILNGTVPGTNYNIWLTDDNPFKLPAFEEIAVQATSSIGASTERATFLHWLSDGDEPIPRGNVVPLRFTATGTAVASAWSPVTITWGDSIPSGVYAMVLSECYGTTQQAHRWIVSNQTWRPGFPSFANAISRHPYAVNKGQFGLMGRFRSTDLPRLQVLCTAADAAYTGYLHVVKVGNLN